MRFALPAVLALACALPVSAQEACDAAPASAGSWSAPLDRTITVHAGLASLPDALDRLTTAGRIRLSYSRDLLPQQRRACLEFDRVPLGAALAAVLHGTELTAIVAGGNHVGLAAAQRAAAAAEPQAEPVIVLDRIDVNADAARAADFAGVPGSSIDARAIERQGGSNLFAALNGLAPGVWVWPQSGGAVVQYGSIRGASSFRASSPKLYIDGLEVANPDLVAVLDPATVERIEVVRGPQGAALYGADAIAGVTRITTRQVDLDGSGVGMLLRSGVGLSGTSFNRSSALEQTHGLSALFGGSATAARLDLSFSSLGAYVPGAAQRALSLVGSARTVGQRFSLAGTLRLLSDRTRLSSSPLLPPAGTHAVGVDQYTAGITASYAPSERWVHSLVVGVNGYVVNGALPLDEAVSVVDSALAAAGRDAYRTTLRLTSTAQRTVGSELRAKLTLTAEHSLLHQDGGVTAAAYGAAAPGGGSNPLLGRSVTGGELEACAPAGTVRQRSSAGVSTRFDLSFGERFRLSGGLRAEQGTLENDQAVGAMLPSFGASWLARRGEVSVALRAAYGRGIRWPQLPSMRGYQWRYLVVPEVQSGLEAGVDVAWRERLALHVTRFGQLAQGLAVPIAQGRDSLEQVRTVPGGAIANRGWEITADARGGPLALAASLSLVDSRVRELVRGYAGELLPGDRVLGVPARTLAVTASWTRPHWNASASVSRAFDWIEYDRLAVARAGEVSGSELRDYWLRYRGATRLGATLSRDLGARFSLQLVGQNLLDRQTGEPHNAAVVPGRTLSLALRTRL